MVNRKPRKPKNYINNRTLYEVISEYHGKRKEAVANGLPLPAIPNYIGQAFMLLANNYSKKSNFIGYPFREEMVSDGIENCIMQVHSFDPAKSNNPFAYFTQIIKNAFIRRIKKEKKQQYIKIKNYDNLYTSDELAWNIQGRTSLNEITQDFVKNYEETMRANVGKQITKRAKKKADADNFDLGISKFTE